MFSGEPTTLVCVRTAACFLALLVFLVCFYLDRSKLNRIFRSPRDTVWAPNGKRQLHFRASSACDKLVRQLFPLAKHSGNFLSVYFTNLPRHNELMDTKLRHVSPEPTIPNEWLPQVLYCLLPIDQGYFVESTANSS